MGRILGVAFFVISAIAAGVLGATWLAIVVGLAAIGVAGWSFTCRHPGPLGLLPPIEDANGHRTEAQWYCDRCGRSWPAAIDHGRPPVQRFTGYDESKAVRAAKRADELSARQRDLAVRRAGLNRGPSEVKTGRKTVAASAAKTTPFKQPAGPVPVHDQRAAS